MHSIKSNCLTLLLILLLATSSFGQTSKPLTHQQDSSKDGDDAVVRITTNLIQVDVVVTDKHGKLVTDLKPEDFEIFEDGRSQKITNFSFISVAPSGQPAAPVATAGKNIPPMPPTQLNPEQVTRTIAIVVDDLGLSFESLHFVRRALKKFVDEQIQPGDLVAIIPTSGGVGTLEQFTTDKRQLNAAINQIHFRIGRAGISALEPITPDQDFSPPKKDEPGTVSTDIDAIRQDFFSVGTLGAINHVIRGLKQLPGRKAIVLYSDGFPLHIPNNPNSNRVFEAVRRLTDFANRASVVTYTIDARGVQPLGLTAADNLSPAAGGFGNPRRFNDRILDALDARRGQYFNNQDGLKFLADSTGGFFTTDIDGIKRALEDQTGYYLIGYDPDESTFDSKGRKQLHKLSVKVKRSGLKVRSRGGFYGFTDEEARLAIPTTRSEQLVHAISSPFVSKGVTLRLTPIFLHDESKGTYLRTLLHIDANNLSFADEADGWHKSDFDILAVTFGGDWNVVDQVNRTHTIRAAGETYDRMMKEGFAYIIDVPIKEAGPYQFRVVVRDSKTERVGSASQFIEVPNVKKGDLTLSGIIVNGSDPKLGKQGGEAEANSMLSALRKFHRGMVMNYGYFIYNARLSRSLSRPQLRTQMKLYRNGQEVFAGGVQVYDPSNQNDMKSLVGGGRLVLGTVLEPGEYVLQVIVTDDLSNEKNRTATQSIDFEIVE